MGPRLTLMALVGLTTMVADAQPGVANRCVLWEAARLEDGSLTDRFAPEPIPDGPHYLHYIIMLNGDERKILTELAPKWAPHEDVNIPGNGYYGCELANFRDPEISQGDKITVIVTDEAHGQQAIAEAEVPALPGSIHLDVQMAPVEWRLPSLRLADGTLSWDEAAATTLVYRRDRDDRYDDGRPRGLYELALRLTDGETEVAIDEPDGGGWMIVQQDDGGSVIGRSRAARLFAEPDGYASEIFVGADGAVTTVDHGTMEATVWSADGEQMGTGALTDVVPPDTHTWPDPPDGLVFRRARVALTDGSHLWLDGIANELVQTADGDVVRTFRGEAFGGLERPRAMALGPNGDVYVLANDGIVIVPSDLEEELPEIDGRTVRWRTGAPVRSEVTVAGQGTEAVFTDGKKKRRAHEVEIGDLAGAGRYRVTVNHSIRMAGTLPDWTGADLLIPPSKEGYTPHLRVPIAIVILTNAVQEGKIPDGVEHPGPISDAEVERLIEEMRVAQRFYWINSHLNCFLDMDFIIDREPRNVEDFSAAYRPTRENLKPILDAQGKNLDDYAGVCRIIAEQAYDANTQTWRLAGRGGGFTSGVTEGTEDPGWSWWRACAEDYFIPDAWLFVHEYGHQIDAMYHASGGPEFWGNHFAPQEGNVARFGEHFDGMAYVLRWWEPSKYFGSDWGTVEFAVDVDGDGIPDDAPELPIDEKRFGSDSTETDTDNDGLSDIDELKLLNTVERGLGQIWAAPILPDPTDPDTDGDGERDGDDGQPLYRNTAIGPPDVPTEFRPIIGAGMTCSVGGAWGPDGLEIDWQTDEPRRVMIQIDADNDGWFVGRDNYHITIDPPSTDGEAPRVNAHIMNCAEPGKWPFDDKDLIEAGDLECFVIDGMTGYQLKLILGPSPETGLELKAGETIGINYGVAHPIRNATFLMAFQPHSLVPMTLEEF